MNEDIRKAVASGYRTTPYVKPGSVQHGWKKWPEDWTQQKLDNTDEVNAWRSRIIATAGSRKGF